MRHACWPVFLLAAVAGCSDTDTPTNPDHPSLAKPGATGVRILDLGTLGGKQSYGQGLNTPAGDNRLLVVGTADRTAAAPAAAYWLVDVASLQVERGFLPLLESATQSTAWDVNQLETMIGWSYFRNPDGTSAGSRATRWARTSTSWTAHLIPTLDASSRHNASAINAQGLIAGSSPNGAGEERFYDFDGSTTTDRGGLGGLAEAQDVNIHGTIVGGVHGEGPMNYAFVSHLGTPPTLLPDFGGRSVAHAINDHGVIVGYATNAAGESRAVRWTRSPETSEYVAEDLGLSRARVWDVNNQGEMVGSFVGKFGERPFYQTSTGLRKELPILSYAGIAYAINERAEVTGISVVRNAYTHAVLWTNVR